jgi:hypothetical protein
MSSTSISIPLFESEIISDGPELQLVEIHGIPKEKASKRAFGKPSDLELKTNIFATL